MEGGVRLGDCLGCGWGCVGGVAGEGLRAHRGCGYGRGWGGPEGASGVWLWLGDAWGADLVWMRCG